MKKIILFLPFILLLTFSVNAQDGKFGVRAGLNASNFFADENPDDQNLRYSLNAGIYSRAALIPELLFIETGLGYNGRGSTVTGSGGEATLGLGYLEVPVLASVSLADIIHLQGGVYAAYLLSAEASVDSNFGSFSTDLDRDDFNNFDFGLSVGATINPSPLMVGVRYNYGLTNILEGNDIADFFGSRAQNSMVQLFVGFEF
ncbi:MAG: PorT family protein [Cyclobacteriaceae bacterium]|nr:PorT family protein [Cyclobacteriaceae bacterium]MCH8516872.1 PorT family protein [Cyclobacteriaceae bacterium]